MLNMYVCLLAQNPNLIGLLCQDNDWRFQEPMATAGDEFLNVYMHNKQELSLGAHK